MGGKILIGRQDLLQMEYFGESSKLDSLFSRQTCFFLFEFWYLQRLYSVESETSPSACILAARSQNYCLEVFAHQWLC